MSLTQSASEQRKWNWERPSLRSLFKKMKKISVVVFWMHDFFTRLSEEESADSSLVRDAK